MKLSNKLFFCSSMLCLFLLTACNNATESKLSYTDNETVRNVIKQKESEISWTKELEPDRLLEDYSSDNLVNDELISFTPDVAKILKNYNKKQYPELIDFGKLDTSSLPYSVLEKINNFCEAVSLDIYSGPESFFNSSYKFNYVFFKNDFINDWEKNFEVEFPFSFEVEQELKEKKQKNDQINSKIKNIEEKLQKYQEWKESKKNLDEQTDEFSIDTLIGMEEPIETADDIIELKKELVEIEEFHLFNKWLIGEPFIGDEIIEMPVRYYCNQGTVDITLYLNQKKQNSIYQITIDRWCKA